MIIQNLNFFDKFGKNLNLDWNSEKEYWEGIIYFPELSTLLYDNENIFILEKDSNDYKFPILYPGEYIKFDWEDNKNEDELFLYEVEKDLELKNLFLNRKDSIIVSYDDIQPSSTGAPIDIRFPLQVNIAFNPLEEKKYERSLFIYIIDETSPNQKTVAAKIKFYGEGLDEDVRFNTWLQNFGIKFNKEDANILKDYDIKEAYPDWAQLNLARKSLLVNRDQIFPYIGTYKGLSNFVNVLGYKDILQVKEYWKNINPTSPYFNKHSLVDITDYLDDGKIDNMNILDRNYNLKFNDQFRKTEFLALVYQFNKITDNFDDDGIPEVEETSTFTVDEVFYKLNRLKQKLKNEILPINVKIKDIIGEFLYFQKLTIKFWPDNTRISDFDLNEKADLQYYPDASHNFIIRSLSPLFRKKKPNGPDFGSVILNDGHPDPYESGQRYPISEIPSIIDYIKSFYNEIRDQRYPDIGKKLSWETGDDPEKIIGAPAVFNVFTDRFDFQNFKGVTFEDLDSLDISLDPYFTLGNLDFKNFYEITWRITKDAPKPYNFEYRGPIKDLYQLPHFLPYAGKYRVTAELHDFYGNTSVFSKIVTVETIQKPYIVGITRLEDKFNYQISNLANVQLIDFGSSPNYFPKVNVLDNEDAVTRIDAYKNILEWGSYYYNRYGTGQNLYDVEFYDSDSQSYIKYNSPFQDNLRKNYWGLGTDKLPVKLEDFDDITLDSLFFMRFRDLIYTDDFNAGFYLQNPKPGQTIKISLFSSYTIPQFSSLKELSQILNDSEHPGIKLFNYEVIKGRKSDKQFIIHAQAEYLSKEMYHMLFPGAGASPSPTSSPGSSGSAGSDEYTFFHPRNVYSKRLVDHFKSISPVFDEETLFLFSKTSDLLTGAAQDPSFWVDKKYWIFNNDIQRGYLPTLIDQNSFNINDIKLFEGTINVPENATVFLAVNNLDGKSEFIWTLYNSATGEEIIRTRSVPFFAWKFKDLGTYTIKVDVIDNKGGFYSNQIDKMINVLDKNQYINIVENKLNRRKNILLKKSN